MLTYNQVLKLLSPGDTVFSVRGNAVLEHTGKSILPDCLDIGEDLLFYDEHRELWFLTQCIAKKLRERRSWYEYGNQLLGLYSV